MANSIHVHRLSPSWWLGNIFLGVFGLLIVVGGIIFNTSKILSDTSGFAMFLMLLLVVLPVSLVFLARPFLTRMIVKPEGLEYHSTFFVLQTNWNHLVNIGYVQKTNTGKTLVVVPRAGNLTLRKWAKPFRNLLKEYPNKLQDIEILVSQFGEHNGHSFETDILVNVAQHLEFSETLESLKP